MECRNQDIPSDLKMYCFGCMVVVKAELLEFIGWKWGEKVEIINVIASFRHLYGGKKKDCSGVQKGHMVKRYFLWRWNRDWDMCIGCKMNIWRVIGLMEQSSGKKQKIGDLDVKGSNELRYYKVGCIVLLQFQDNMDFFNLKRKKIREIIIFRLFAKSELGRDWNNFQEEENFWNTWKNDKVR